MKKIALTLALMCSTPAMAAEEHYFRGFLEVFSAGVCATGNGECHSYLSVEGVINDVCSRKPKVTRVVGHSMGAGAALRFVHGVTTCGVKVEKAVFLDALTKPYDIPKHTQVILWASPAFYGHVEGYPGVRRYDGGHIQLAFDTDVRRFVRFFLDGPRSIK